MSDDMFPRVMAYFVGGPADGQEREVSAGNPVICWSEVVPLTPTWLTDAALHPTVATIRVHTYKPCPETGEWLWQGVR